VCQDQKVIPQAEEGRRLTEIVIDIERFFAFIPMAVFNHIMVFAP
jgi:hypothetical protein